MTMHDFVLRKYRMVQSEFCEEYERIGFVQYYPPHYHYDN